MSAHPAQRPSAFWPEIFPAPSSAAGGSSRPNAGSRPQRRGVPTLGFAPAREITSACPRARSHAARSPRTVVPLPSEPTTPYSSLRSRQWASSNGPV